MWCLWMLICIHPTTCSCLFFLLDRFNQTLLGFSYCPKKSACPQVGAYCYNLYCMSFHLVIFITLMEICFLFLGATEPTWRDTYSWSTVSSWHYIIWWWSLVGGVSLLLGWMVIVLTAWSSSHMCLPCWSPLGCTFDGCGAYYHIWWFGIYAYLGYGWWFYPPKGLDDDG